MNYTNQASFIATWSEQELDVLSRSKDNLPNDGRFDSLSSQAKDYIDAYLFSGGYEVPTLFTPFGEVQDILIVPPLPYLNGTIQRASDSIVAFYLAQSTDRMKKPYEVQFNFWTDYLEKIAFNKINISFLNKRYKTSGLGQISVLTRPKVFTQNILPLTPQNVNSNPN